MPQLPKTEDLTKLVKDALYISVGLSVLGFQKVQVQRQELRKQLRSQVADARGQLGTLSHRLDERVQLVEERLSGVEGRIDAALDGLEQRLPGQAKELSRQARAAAKDARGQVRGLVRTGNGNGSAAG